MIELVVKDEGILSFLRRAQAGMKSAQPLTRAWAGTLESETEKNFAAQGRPRWLGLKPPVSPRRKDGKLLQDSGQLAASVVTDYGPDHTRIGSNKPYAAIHQFGGITRAHVILPKNKKALAFGGRVVKRVNHPGSKIPARPYMPFMANGEVQPEAREALIKEATDYLRSLVGS